MSFVHLHVHTEYSLLDGMSGIRELFERAEALGQPGLAITDHGNICGAAEFLSTARRYHSVKPIVGCEVYLTDHYDHRIHDREHRGRFHLILLAKNLAGYRNLVKIASEAGTAGMGFRPCISHEYLESHAEGLIALSACIGGEIPQRILDDDMDGARAALEWYRRVYGEDFYLEVCEHRSTLKDFPGDVFEMQRETSEGIFSLSEETGVKVVATNDVHFVLAGDGPAHDTMLAANTGKKVTDVDRMRYSQQEYLKSEEEMRAVFPTHPEVISNTLEVLEKVERFDISGDCDFPFEDKDGLTPYERLENLVREGAETKFRNICGEHDKDIKRELGTLSAKRGAAEYLLFCKRLCDALREAGYVVGPGCGRAPASLVCYCLGLTQVVPDCHGLLFDCFLNDGEESRPYLQLDVSSGGIAFLKDYLEKKLGAGHVAEIPNFLRWTESSAEELVSRAGGNPAAAHALESRLSGIMTGRHVKVLLCSKEPLSEHIPIMKSRYGEIISQYDAHGVLDTGPFAISVCELGVLDNFRESRQDDWPPASYDDGDVLALFARGDTEGVFLFESDVYRDGLRRLGSCSFEDLVALQSIWPAGGDVFEEYIERNRGDRPSYPVLPFCDDILRESRGLLLYQEQVVRILHDVCALPYGKADHIRRIIVRGGKSGMDTARDCILEGLGKLGADAGQKELFWEAFRRDGASAAPKAHNVGRVALAYWTAWRKAGKSRAGMPQTP